MLNRLVTAAWLLAGGAAHAATLNVGPGQQYTTVSAAVAAAQNGDTVLVQAGTYENDFPNVRTNITLQATGGRVTMKSHGNIPNAEGILLVQADATVDGFTFTGARVTRANGENGAGLRYLSGNLTVRNCWFKDNQDGLFANPSGGTITISNSQFDHNGDAKGPASGHTHNLYVDQVAKLTVTDSYFTQAIEGHEIKSRALVTVIANSRLVDGPGSTASYSIDLPNGGNATLTNLKIEQGPDSSNGIIIAFGEEGDLPDGSHMVLSKSLMENDLTQTQPIGVWNDSNASVTLSHVRVFGLTPDQLTSGAVTLEHIAYSTREPKISGKHPF